MLQLEMQPQNVEVNSFIMVDSGESPRPKVRGFLVGFIH